MTQNLDFSSAEMKTFPKLIIASTDESADLLYAGGFNAPDEFLYYETASEKCIVVSPLEYARAVSEVRPGVKVIERSRFLNRENPEDPVSVVLSRTLGIDCWRVPARFPLAEAEKLRSAGIRLSCCHDPSFFPEREIKSPTEQNAIQQSQAATEEIMREFRQILIDSKINPQGFLEYRGRVLTSDFLRMELEGNFKRMGYTASRTIFAHGPQGAEPHNLGSGPIRANEPVVADIFPRSDLTGYWGDMTRTYVKGKASPVVKRAFKAVLAASEAAKKLLRAGVSGAEAHQTAADILIRAGFPSGCSRDGKPCGFFHGLGHGVGLEIHENPRLSPLNPKPLQSGNVVSVEPGLYYSDWGGIRLEDLVVVTSDSCRCFNTMEMELEIP
ncbi:MAG: aminopeptidase P family protein [Lentisphaeria bacterium]|nr:aminopeptidase P family protein [Lentisphaeria bacterium]